MKNTLTDPIAIDGHMVIIPAEDYQILLKEAGYASTPKLTKRIVEARVRYAKKKVLSWDKVKHDL